MTDDNLMQTIHKKEIPRFRLLGASRRKINTTRGEEREKVKEKLAS